MNFLPSAADLVQFLISADMKSIFGQHRRVYLG
jgi:hypothetical protein